MNWKPFLTNYLVSDEGHVMNKFTGRYLRASSTSRTEVPYMIFTLMSGRVKKSYAAKLLIARVFLPNPNNYKHVMHIDGNPLNFKVNNLKWVEYQECSYKQRGKNTIKDKKPLIEGMLRKGHSYRDICEEANTYSVALKQVYSNVYNIL